MVDCLDTHQGLPHEIRREYVFDDCIQLYTNKSEVVLGEFPLRIHFTNEIAVDTGGVCRDMFSAFWEAAYLTEFDGSNLLVPAVHPGTDMAKLPALGAILSHGFLSCGFLPVRLAFPVIATVLLGPLVSLPDAIIMESFIDFLSSYESSILRQAVEMARTTDQASYAPYLQDQLVDILSRLGCRELSTPRSVQQLVLGVARHEFLVKPLGALYALHAGVPKAHHDFWSHFSVDELFTLYLSLNATPAAVIQKIEEPIQLNSAAARVFDYLIRFIGNMKQQELRLFLRFVTGSSVLIDKPITVTFNALSGFARRPTSHTCACSLQLPTTYVTYPEFAREFSMLLSSEVAWAMDAL